MSSEPGSAPLYAGRFKLLVPSGSRVTNAEVQLREIDITEVGWASGALGGGVGHHSSGGVPHPARDAAAQAWASRLAVLRADSSIRPAKAADVVITQRQLAPDLWLLLRHNWCEDARFVAAEALLDAGAQGLWLRAAYRSGHAAEVVDLFTRLARSYRAYAPGVVRPEDGPAFHLPKGALHVPWHTSEYLRASLVHEAYTLGKLRLVIGTGADPEWGEGLAAAWRARQQDPALAHALGDARMTLLRAGPRTVGGLPGEEVVASFGGAGGSAELGLMWGYRGEDLAATRPQVQIEAHSPGGDTTEVLTAWDELLTSFRALPQANDAAGGPT